MENKFSDPQNARRELSHLSAPDVTRKGVEVNETRIGNAERPHEVDENDYPSRLADSNSSKASEKGSRVALR